ncbi:MAG: (R)-hydratase [Chloroflexi bacterium]|nr:(R)-hydratase [Chloroflexota bacterium]
MKPGTDLNQITKQISMKQIRLYAEASGDFNPIHVDEEYAKKSQYGHNIAHGMMVAAPISEIMTSSFGSAWHSTGKMKIRFRAPVFPGDMITATGHVKEITETNRGSEIRCTIAVTRQTGEVAVSGITSVTVSSQMPTNTD